MSSPKLNLDLSPLARSDLRGILRYSEEQWGAARAEMYEEEIHSALETLCDLPRIGIRREGFAYDVRFYLMGSHVIVYRICEGHLHVLRILHQRMKVGNHLAG